MQIESLQMVWTLLSSLSGVSSTNSISSMTSNTWWQALNLSFRLVFVSPLPILCPLGKETTLPLKKGHYFWRWYISACRDTSSFHLRLKFLSVTKSLNHLLEWAKICIALQTPLQWLFLPFLEKTRLLSRFHEICGQLRLEQFYQFCSTSKQQRKVDFECYFVIFFVNW